MEWLHFSDFHFKNTSGPQHEAILSLLKFLTADLARNPGTIDAVFLVGDIAYSGLAEEYRRFENDFLRPLLEIPSLKGAKVFSVPGNHDVDCDAASPITWEGIRRRNRELYFSEDTEGLGVRRHRVAVFTNYWDFVTRNKILSPNPFKEVSILYTEPTFPFDILATNTSYFADKDENSSQAITPCPLNSLRHWSASAGKKRPRIILGHHSVATFLADQQTPFATYLIDNSAIYLHGHEHTPKLSHNSDGTLQTFGFGAVYLSPLGSATHAPYRNSFARCKITDRLRLNGFTWDCHVGRWDDTTKAQFAASLAPEDYDGHSAILRIPLLSQAITSIPVQSSLSAMRRRNPRLQAILPVVAPTERIWVQLISLTKSLSAYYRNTTGPAIQSAKEIDGKCELVAEQSEKRDLIVCIPGLTHILSSKELESYNTQLDTEDLRSVTILSLGKISHEARDMYFRLRTRKAIEVLVNSDLTAEAGPLLSARQAEILQGLDAAKDTANLLIAESAIYLLTTRSGDHEAFQIIDSTGVAVHASHAVVAELRARNPDFATMRYGGEPISTGEIPRLLEFDEAKYLQQCHAEYNAIRYAALANVGIRFSDYSLENVYIDASAREIEGSQTSRVDALLDDHLAVYPLSDKLKAQIKQQLIGQTGEVRQETSQAREFCQKFGAVVLTGDPGSGKTCFVKSEVLAYSRRAIAQVPAEKHDSDEWHSLHIPVLIQLSQAAAEPDLEKVGLLHVASRLLERRGFYIPVDKLLELLDRGRLAVFFDGLDEVVSVEKRALVVQHINDIVAKSLSRGNRFVVTSRPAAINVVNLLPALRKLELQGLSNHEIRMLAHRILSLRVADAGDGVLIHEKMLAASDNAIVNQLGDDCANNPGVARFATNPLLLTLLVMIYANSGAPSAKRHRIYEEAIKTLASVRGRQAGLQPVSVQDLRERLGAVALSVYRKESGFLPTRKEVIEIVQAVMTRQRGEATAAVEAHKFIQKVAESTGLIVLGGVEGANDESGVVTFMHHSFMEYFAAVGLSKEMERCDVAALVTQPRWIEILTLLAGIIGEDDDIAPVLGRFVGDGSRYGDVDGRYLLFALDCALECEVPSESSVRLVCQSIRKCFEVGPAKADPWIRSEIGRRLCQLVEACGLQPFEQTIVDLMLSEDGDVAAAGLSLSGYVCEKETESRRILDALEQCCTRSEETVLCSICEATSRVVWFRSHAAMQIVTRCLKKSDRCRRAAFDAILDIPGIASKYWPEIINGLDDPDSSVRRLASRAAVKAGLDSDLATLSDAKKDLVADALKSVSESFGMGEFIYGSVRVETVEQLLRSALLRDRIVAIQLMPSMEATPNEIYSKLIDIVDRNDDHQEVTAAIRAIRSSPPARVLLTVQDLRKIGRLCQNGTSDVRKASIGLVGCFSADGASIKTLLDLDIQSLPTSEYEIVIASLGRVQVLQEDVVNLIEMEILRRNREAVRMTEANVLEMVALLDAAKTLAKNLSSEVTLAVRDLIQDYRKDDRIKRAALRAYPATAIPTLHVVHRLAELFVTPPIDLITELAQSLGSFASNCRQSVEHVIACVDSLPKLRDAAVSLHQKLLSRPVTDQNELIVTELRDGIHDVSQIIVTFEEFIGPARAGKG